MSHICPRCGATIHDKTNPTCYNCLRIEQEQKRYGRRRPSKPQKFPSDLPLAPPPVIKAKKEAVAVPLTARQEQQRRAVNQLLANLYNSPRFLSDILRDGQLTNQEITQLKQNHLSQFLDALVKGLLAFWQNKLSWQEFEMLRTKYALDGKPVPMKRALMKQFNISWDQIDAYRERALHRLRYPSQITQLEKLVVKTARDTLKARSS